MTPAAPLIRDAAPDDLDRLNALWAALMRDQNRYIPRVRLTKSNREAVRAHHARLIAVGQLLVLEHAGAVGGFAAIVADLPPIDMHFATATLSDIYLEPALRGRGWGRALLEAAIERVRERGLHGLQLSVAVDNEAARGLYRDRGFRPLSERLLLPLDSDFVRFPED